MTGGPSSAELPRLVLDTLRNSATADKNALLANASVHVLKSCDTHRGSGPAAACAFKESPQTFRKLGPFLNGRRASWGIRNVVTVVLLV